MNLWFLFVATLAVGCDTMPAAPMLGEPVQTPIPSGIYTGRLMGVSRTYDGAGALVRELPIEFPVSPTFDVSGLPVIVPGRQSVVGLVFELSFGGNTATGTIKSVNVSGNRLVIGYDFSSMPDPDISISGSGTYTYEFAPPNTVNYTSSVFEGATTPQGFFTTITEGSAQVVAP